MAISLGIYPINQSERTAEPPARKTQPPWFERRAMWHAQLGQADGDVTGGKEKNRPQKGGDFTDQKEIYPLVN